MRPVLTAELSRAQDELAEDPPSTLLERAGLAVALEAVRQGAEYGRRVVVLCGPGNNGGDGYVAARVLAERGVFVECRPFGEPRSSEAAAARTAAIDRGVRVGVSGRAPDLVIDALYGAGFRGDLPDLSPWAGVAVVAVDVPSGLHASTGEAAPGALSAVSTVTFGGPKLGHLIGDGPDLVGDLVVADIGLPDVAPMMMECEAVDAPVPRRDRRAHKWSSGAVLVVGGSMGLDGAATLTARSALRAGAGAVMLACPPSVEDRVRAPEIMTRAIGKERFAAADLDDVLDLADRYDTLVVGPGMGPDVGDFVRRVLAEFDGDLLLDADALNAVSAADLRPGVIITPHACEFERLTGTPATYAAATDLAAETGATVLLKGSPTFVLHGSERWVITSGGRELATIGTGDVLAGTIGALWAGGLDGPTAARSGAYWHGVAGSRLAERQIVTADALVDEVAVVVSEAGA